MKLRVQCNAIPLIFCAHHCRHILQGRRRAVPAPLQEAGLAASWEEVVVQKQLNVSHRYLGNVAGNKILEPQLNQSKDKSTFMFMLQNMDAVPPMFQYVDANANRMAPIFDSIHSLFFFTGHIFSVFRCMPPVRWLAVQHALLHCAAAGARCRVTFAEPFLSPSSRAFSGADLKAAFTLGVGKTEDVYVE